jgi:hypothetical protein
MKRIEQDFMPDPCRPVFLLFFLLAACLTITEISYAGQLSTDGETAVYKTMIERKGNSGGWADKSAARYKPVQWTQRIRIIPEGILWSRTELLNGGGKNEMTAVIRERPQIRVVSWTETLTSPSGAQESRLDADFTDPSLKYPADMAPAPVFPFLARSTDLKSSGVRHEARIWWGPKAFSTTLWEVVGIEKITVPAGTFKCYVIKGKILIEGDGFISDLIQQIVPRFYIYLTVESPHYMVKLIMPTPGRETQTDVLIGITPGK